MMLLQAEFAECLASAVGRLQDAIGIQQQTITRLQCDLAPGIDLLQPMQLAGAVAPKKRGRVPGDGVAQKVKVLLVIAVDRSGVLPGSLPAKNGIYPCQHSVPRGGVAQLRGNRHFDHRRHVLHDEMEMQLQPFSFNEEEEREWTDQEMEAGGRMVIAAIGPTIAEYNMFRDPSGPFQDSEIELSPALEVLAASHSNAGPGNAYYKAHINLLKRILEVVRSGGSAICRGTFIQEAIQTASKFPLNLFDQLDRDWRQFAEGLQGSRFGPVVPPVLSIVLTRTASREKIPAIVRDLKEELSVARTKVWNLADNLKNARTFREAQELERELRDSSNYFSPLSERSSHPLQVLWELFVGTIGGAATATVIGGDPKIGAATGLMGQAIKAVQKDAEFGHVLFGRGAFDLAKRVRREVERVELDALSAILSDSEKKERLPLPLRLRRPTCPTFPASPSKPTSISNSYALVCTRLPTRS
jgi:hypothetical protein